MADATPSLTQWRRLATRIGIIGAPNKGKTQSLLTFPPPVALVSMPGEMGINTVPLGVVEGREVIVDPAGKVIGHPYFFEPVAGDGWYKAMQDVKDTVAKIISDGAHQTLALDGLHNYYLTVLNVKSGGALARGEDFEGRRAYGQAASLFFQDLRSWLRSSVPYVAATMWMSRDQDSPNTAAQEKVPRSHYFADLAGKSGQRIAGEFAVFLQATTEGTGRAARYIWKTDPDDDVWGVGVKMPVAQRAKLPPQLPQEWAKLAPYLVMGTGERTILREPVK